MAITTTVLLLVLVGGIGSVAVNPIQSAEAKAHPRSNCVPIGVSGDNVYLSWLSNKTGNWETMFRASDDNGRTFDDKINLSNASGSDSQDPGIAANDDNVYMSWWETSKNGTEIPVFRASNDNAETFGPILKLGATGPIGSTGGQ